MFNLFNCYNWCLIASNALPWEWDDESTKESMPPNIFYIWIRTAHIHTLVSADKQTKKVCNNFSFAFLRQCSTPANSFVWCGFFLLLMPTDMKYWMLALKMYLFTINKLVCITTHTLCKDVYSNSPISYLSFIIASHEYWWKWEREKKKSWNNK